MKKSIIYYIILLVIGLILFILGCFEIVDSFFSGLGGGLCGVSIMKLLDEKIELNNKINNHLAPHLRKAQIAAGKRRGQIPQPDGCLHTDGKVSRKVVSCKFSFVLL